MPSPLRLRRIADRVQQELSEIILMNIRDPRVAGISITDVKIDRELAYADIYVSAIEGQQRAPEILKGLKSAKGFIRKTLAQRIQLRSFPQLRFHWDPTPERGDHIEKLLSQIREETQPTEPMDEGDNATV